MKWIPITEGVWGGDIVECLVKLKSGKIVRLNYNYDDQFWYYPSTDETPTAIKKDVSDIEYWVNIKDIDKNCNNDLDSGWYWDFGATLANTAIPALEHWIEHGVSYDPNCTPEEWKAILTKILDTFKLCKADLDGDGSDLESKDPEVRKKAYEDHKQKRREGFQLLADYYLSMWD